MCAKDKKPLIVAVVVTVIFAILSLLYAGYITDLLTSESQMHLSEVATQGAASVQRQVARDFDILEVLADGSIADPNVPLSAKIERIKKQATKFDLFRIGIVDLKGNAITSDDHEFSVSDREFFKSAVEGTRFISQPIIDKVDKVTPGIVYAVPVYNEGEVASVLFSGYELDKLTERIDISFYHESGIAFITDSSGKILLHPNKDRIGRNIVEVAMVLNKRDEVEKFKNDLLSGASGVSHFKMKEEDRFFAYAPIKGANDWFLLTSLPAVSVFERSQKVILFTVILLVSIAVIFAIVVAYIVVTKKKSNERIIKLAYYDQLTGAPNAECFKIEARDLCNKFEEEKYTLLNFDVRQFRYLNNDLGYEAGNHLLIHIADCLANTVSRDETYARVGNDQFLLLVSIGNDGEQMRKYIYDLYEKIAKWQQPTGGYYSINMNFGVYKLNSEDTDIMSAMEKSNIARKSTKVGHETDIAVYDTAMQIKIDQDTELEKSMPKALENGEFKLYIQPKYDLLSERIVGGEALVRWVKADGTMIMPDEFISLFEQTGAIYRMDMYMLEQLCKFLSAQTEKNIHSVPVSINQSRRYMYSPDYVPIICKKLKENDVLPEMIEIEITESIVYTDVDKLMVVLEELHQEGFKVSLDDFGSGYSSLNVLKNLQVDTIKLDRFMLGETMNSDKEKAVVANIIRMSKELQISVVAEGVETKEQVIFLRDCGCETAQGYYYSKPVPAQKFEELLLTQQQGE